MRRAVLWFAAAVTLALVLFGGWHLFGDRPEQRAGAGGAAEGGPAGTPPPPVEVVPVTVDTVEVTVESIGTVAARDSLTVTTSVIGIIAAIHFTEGEHVEAGTVLVELDANEQRAALAEARAARFEARRQLDRAEQLVESDFVSAARVDELRAAAQAAEARVQAAEARLADRVVTAPFAGRLGLRQVSPGALVQPGTPITTLTATDTVELLFDVPEGLLPRLRPGLTVRASAPAFGDRSFAGRVAVIDTAINPATRTVTLKAELPNPDALLRPGLFMNVRLVVERREEAVLVPEEAVLFQGNASLVFTVGPQDVASQVAVETGIRRAGRVEIRRGLAPGDRVVVAGLQKIADGQTVQPLPAGGAPERAAADAAGGASTPGP